MSMNNSCLFFLSAALTTASYTLSLHDALPIWQGVALATGRSYRCFDQLPAGGRFARYWIEAIGLDGSSDWQGPVATVYAPGLSLDAASPSFDELGDHRRNGDQENNVGNVTLAAA